MIDFCSGQGTIFPDPGIYANRL